MSGRRLGDLTIMRSVEMIMESDALEFFPETTEADWAPHRDWLSPDALNAATGALLFPVQSYVVRTSHHTILVDTCVGNDKPRPYRPAWHQKSDDAFLRSLARHGVAPEDVDYVMCTHLHGDHVGWNTCLEDGRWVPTFRNARYVFARDEVAAWETGDARFPRTPYEDSVLPIVEAGRAVLVDNDFALDDEVWLEPTPGHTPGHAAIRLASRGANAVLSGDLIHSPVQCRHPEWVAWPDWDPELAKRTRRAFLERYCETDTFVCTAHFPLPSAGRIVADGDAFGFEDEDASW